MHVNVTAGPTREHLDDVRFLSNASSGRMGYAIARAAASAGHRVTLVSGPVALHAPEGVKLIRVISTQEMYDAAARAFVRSDCLIGAAAPADFRPARRIRGKAKKAAGPRSLPLKPTVDILASLGRKKRRQVIIAFALEAQRPVTNALAKLKSKNADAVVLNRPEAMGSAKVDVTVFTRDRKRVDLRGATKDRIARSLVSLAERLHAERGPKARPA